MIRKGFSLVEVIVAMTLLSIGLLAVGATAFMAARLQTQSTLTDRMTGSTRSVLDSIVTYHLFGNGEAVFGAYRIEWTADQHEVRAHARGAGLHDVEMSEWR